MARLGLKTAALGCIGDDAFGEVLAKLLESESIEAGHLLRHPSLPTSATAVLVGQDGEHTFAHHAGASRTLTRQAVLDNLALFERSQFALFGYYGLMPELEAELSEVLPQIRETGCRTAMDAAGGGGTMQPLDRILPHLDIYVPSYEEGVAQTGLRDPQQIVDAYRQHAPECLLGVKLGDKGALFSPAAGDWIRIEPVAPPGRVVDTTGAGDCFYAGLITGLAREMNVDHAARLGAAAGASSITAIGAVAGIRDFDATRRLAGLEA